jgi:hypothetical protein
MFSPPRRNYVLVSSGRDPPRAEIEGEIEARVVGGWCGQQAGHFRRAVSNEGRHWRAAAIFVSSSTLCPSA